VILLKTNFVAMKLDGAAVSLTCSRAYELVGAALKHKKLPTGVALATLLLLLLLAFGAQGQAYTPLSKDVQYRLHALGEEKVKVGRGCHVQLFLSAATQQGAKVFERTCWLPLGEEPESNSLESSLMALSQGDSAAFIMPAKMLLASLISYPKVKGVANSETLHVNVRVLRVVEPDAIMGEPYEKFCSEYLSYEKRLTNQYLQQNAGFEATGDIWKKQVRPGNGKKAEKFGSAMHIAYEGFFLSGTRFDSTGKNEQPFRYVRGVQWQLIQGLVAALAAMSEGEKAVFVIPSTLAFGTKGLADIVPPFTPVVYEVEVVRVVK
jgi:hypothetical protein